MSKKNKYDVVIVGGGAAGLSAGLYARRYNLKTAIIEGDKPGGWTSVAGVIENYPGVKATSGFEIIKIIKEQNKELEVDFYSDEVIRVQKKAEGKFIVEAKKNQFESKSIVLAHGSKHRELGLKKEKELLGKGVAICAVCDAPFFKDKVVAVVGGGDSSVKGVNLLSEYAKHIYLITIGKELHGEPINMKRLSEKKNCEIIYENQVTEILSEDFLTGIKLKSEYNGKSQLDVQGLFVMIGFIPVTDYYKDLNVHLDDRKFIDVDKFMQTNVSGVVAAGDCTNGTGGFKQTIVAAAQGAMAATSVDKYINDL